MDGLDFCPSSIIHSIFTRSTLTSTNILIGGNQLNGPQVLHHLIPKNRFGAEPERCPMRNRQRFIIQIIGQNGLRVLRKFEVDHLVEWVIMFAIETMLIEAIGSKDEVACLRLWLTAVQDLGNADSRPLANP